MNSSGIKRGLAGSAVAALAVTGLPFLASSADAAVGDSFTVVSAGPALNGDADGAVVVIRAKDGVITPADLNVTGTNSPTAGSEDTADQTVGTPVAGTPVNDPTDNAYELIEVRIPVTTTNTGDTATFRLFEDDTNGGVLDASEARQTVSISTSGPLASIDIAPATQSTPQGIDSGEYTVTLKDAAGRTTQLASGTSITVADEAPVEVNETGPDTDVANDDLITSDEIARGTDTFTVDTNGAAVGEYDITLTQGSVTKTAKLNVTQAAVLDASDIDIVTGADDWSEPGDGADGGATFVRVDQSTVQFVIDAPDSEAGSNVQLSVDGTGVTFGGKDKSTVSTTLDSHGNGALTVAVDAASIQDGDSFDVDLNGFTQTIVFQRAHISDIASPAGVYFSKVGGSVDVTVKVLDQFGLPITSGFVEASRDGVNAAADATPQRKAVGSDGTATFTFTDTKATNGDTENVDVDYFADQFSASPDFSEGNVTTIKYTTDGMGANYTTSLDGQNTEASDYNASKVVAVPLADAMADNDGGNEAVDLGITGGEGASAVTVSVDNGALILAPGKFGLSEGASSVTANLTGGSLTGYRIVGTKSGVVTVTISSANRTETAQFTVGPETDFTTARNVTVSGPATVENGTPQITYTAVVTDAFGNPVIGFPRSIVGTDLLNVQVSGPAQFKDGDTQTDNNGAIKLNVAVQPGAVGDVTIQVKGVSTPILLGGFDQFGAAADRLTAQSTTDDAKGLPASSDTATATTTVEAAAPVQEPIHLSLAGKSKGKKDVITATADDNAAGLTAVLLKNGKEVKSHALNETGDWTFTVKDKNGKKATTYQVKVAPTETTKAGKRSITIK